MTVARFIPDDLAERAKRVLHPWSGATTDERRQAAQLLHAYEQQARNRRIAVPDEFRPER